MMTPLQLQAIIDGEIDHSERARLLQSLEHEDWKELALALLEDREWDNHIHHVVKNGSFAAIVPASDPLPTTQVHPVVRMDDHRTNDSRRNQMSYGFVAIAASLFLIAGFVGGAWMRSQLNESSSNGQNSIASVGSGSISPNRSTNPNASSNNTTQFVSNSSRMPLVESPTSKVRMTLENPEAQTSEFDLYDLKDIDPSMLAAREAYEIARMKHQLRRKGFEADVQPQYYSGQLPNGQQVIVPVRNVVGLRPQGL